MNIFIIIYWIGVAVCIGSSPFVFKFVIKEIKPNLMESAMLGVFLGLVTITWPMAVAIVLLISPAAIYLAKKNLQENK